MPPIDEKLPFKPVHVAVLTVSSTRTLQDDASGDTLVARITKAGHQVVERELVTDSVARIREVVGRWIEDPSVDVVISTGGTGLTGSDSTPEAFQGLYDKEIPGFGELFRQLSYEKIGWSTIQSRATGGVARGTYLFALPGSTGACKDGWDDILRFQLDSRHVPCNLVELMPRLREAAQ